MGGHCVTSKICQERSKGRSQFGRWDIQGSIPEKSFQKQISVTSTRASISSSRSFLTDSTIERSLKLGEGLYITINQITEQFEPEITIHCWYLLILRHDASKARAFYFAHCTRKVESRNPKRPSSWFLFLTKITRIPQSQLLQRVEGPTIDNDAHSYWIPIELGPESTSPFLTVPYV